MTIMMGSSLLSFCLVVLGLQVTFCLIPGNNDVLPYPPKIKVMHIWSSVQSNYAKVCIKSEMVNDGKTSRETTFSVHIPISAFISNFTMALGSRILIGVVKEKTQAMKDFQNAREQGQSAGQVMQEPQDPGRDMEIFSVTVNVAAESSTIFELAYEELVEKKLGVFVQRIHIEPKQIVPNMTLTATVYDNFLTLFEYMRPGLESFSSSSSANVQLSASVNKRMVLYTPSFSDQSKFGNKGIKGDFVIRYDVNRGDEGGIIYHDQRNFVHYFAPKKLEVLDKNIVFIIDISGSMGSPALKIERTRDAMLYILDQLRTNDYFNILLFDHRVYNWSTEPKEASKAIINQAKAYVRERVIARGSTNIHDALLAGMSTLERVSLDDYRGSIIVFLTDGNPTFGITDRDEIRRVVSEKNNGKISLFSLGFGDDVDFGFLEALSLQNNGRAKKIYVDMDADEQLEGFFEQIESPLLTDVNLIYESDVVVASSLTQTSYLQYFQGSEIVTVGQLIPDSPTEWSTYVTGKSRSRTVTLTINSFFSLNNTEFLERLFAYWKIKDLLNKEKITEKKDEKTKLAKEILEMSLHYNFVTPATSMVVTETVHRENSQRTSLESTAVRRAYANDVKVAAFSPNNAISFSLNKYILSFIPFIVLIFKF